MDFKYLGKHNYGKEAKPGKNMHNDENWNSTYW
jgi:hypothetical protein